MWNNPNLSLGVAPFFLVLAKRNDFFHSNRRRPAARGFKEPEPLFLAVICGCNAGLFREVLHEVYGPNLL